MLNCSVASLLLANSVLRGTTSSYPYCIENSRTFDAEIAQLLVLEVGSLEAAPWRQLGDADRIKVALLLLHLLLPTRVSTSLDSLLVRGQPRSSSFVSAHSHGSSTYVGAQTRAC